MDIENKVVVISGGASGLGESCVDHLLSLGARIAVLDLNTQRDNSNASNDQIAFYDVDVTESASLTEVVDKIAVDQGEIRACINCAGIAPAGKTVGRNGALALEKFEQVISVNLIGTFNLVRLVAQKMSKLEPCNADGARGVIINTASVAAFDGQVGQAAYAASKGGVAAMTLPIARDLGPLGIRVNTIAPGVFSTAMLSAMSDEVIKPLEQAVQFPKRLGKPSEFASLVEHIITNDYLNGEVIRLDGGIRMAPS